MTGNVNVAINLVSEQAKYVDTTFLYNKLLQNLAISENGFVFDPTSGQSFSVNETGVELLRLFQQEDNIDAIVGKLNRKYDEDSREIERDVLEFASNLNRYFYT